MSFRFVYYRFSQQSAFLKKNSALPKNSWLIKICDFWKNIFTVLMEKTMPATKKIWLRIIRVFALLAVTWLALLFSVILVLNIPAVQFYITGIAGKWLSEKIDSQVSVGGVNIVFPSSVSVKKVFVADQQADTLLYLHGLNIRVDFFRLISNTIRVKNLEIDGLVSRISRKAPQNEFSFQFIVDAFATNDTLPEPENPASKPWTFDVRNVELTNVSARYCDDVTGLNALLNLGGLFLQIKTLNPYEHEFRIDRVELLNTTVLVEKQHVAALSSLPDTNISAAQNADSTTPLFPTIGLDFLCLENVKARYIDLVEQMDFTADIGKLEFSPEKFDLNRRELDLGELSLENSSFQATLALSDSTEAASVEYQNSEAANIFPDWNITMNQIRISNLEACFDDISALKAGAGLDYGHIRVKGFNLETGKLGVSSDGAVAAIVNFGFSEQSGLVLKKMSGLFEVTNHKAGVQQLVVETPGITVLGSFAAQFASFEALQNYPDQTEILLDVEKLELNTDEIFRLLPDLAADTVLGKMRNRIFVAKASAEGKLKDLAIHHLDVWMSGFTKLKANGRLTGLPDVSRLGFDVALTSLSTNLADLELFIDTALTNHLVFPENYLVKGSAKGNLNDLIAEIEVNTTFGDVSANAFFRKPALSCADTFNLDFRIDELMAGRILSDTVTGSVSFSGIIGGSGITGDTLSAAADFLLSEAFYNNYSYKNIAAKANLNGEKFDFELLSGDPNLNFDLKGNVDLNSKNQQYAALLDLKSLNLGALHFLDDALVISSNVSARAGVDSTRCTKVNITSPGTMLALGTTKANIGSLALNGAFSAQFFESDLKSDLLDADFSANFGPQEMDKTLMAMLRKYFGVSGKDTVVPGRELTFRLDVHLPENIRKLMGSDFYLSDISNMNGFYRSNNNELSVEMQLDRLALGRAQIDTIVLTIDGKNDSLSFWCGLDKMSYDSLKTENVSLSEILKNGAVRSELKIVDKNGLLRYRFANELYFSDTAISVTFVPDGLILDSNPWQVAAGNKLTIKRDGMWTQNFKFSREDEFIGFNAGKKPPELFFRNFDVQNMLNIVDVGQQNGLLRGWLDGRLIFAETGFQTFFDCDLNIDSLYLLDTLVGHISFRALADSNNLTLDFSLKNEQNNIHVYGDIADPYQNPSFNMGAVLDFESLQTFEKFSFGQLSEISGKMKGNIEITGTSANPDITGVLMFDNTCFKINSLNFQVLMRNDKVTFNKNGLLFNDFIVEDARNQKLILNGTVLTENYSEFIFDLSILAKNFQPVNSAATDNPIFYGNLITDTDVKLKGTSDSPEIDATIKINKGTNLTYALPGSELQLITPEGIVHFIDPVSETDSLINSAAGNYLIDSVISRISGIDLRTNLEIDQEAVFTVLIDPRSGDYLSLGGNGLFSIAVDPGGTQTITGIFEVKTGVYQLSFYGLVKKTFTLQQGSNISWSGKPMDANLDITALYEVTTNSVALVANETSTMSETEKNIYKQRLPYTVLLNISGFLIQPEISFNITLPDKYKANYPQVASKLDQLNTEDMESERNKQVFSLLVTGGFIADNPFASTGTTTANIATTAARNSVNGILADQMNRISGKYIKNVDLNFGLNSYEDYSGQNSEIRTELEVQVTKKLFNDRLTIEAQGYFDVEGSNKNNYGNQSSQQMWGEFAIIYSLTPEGDYKLRAFRENAYDFFDGEVAYSGISFIIEKEFDNLLQHKTNNSRTDTLEPDLKEVKTNKPKPEKK